MHEIGLILAALLASLEDRLKGVDEKIVRNRESETNAAQKVAGNNAEYAKVGPLMAFMGKARICSTPRQFAFKEEMAYRTRAEAWGFAKGLLQASRHRITDPQGGRGPDRQHNHRGCGSL